MDMDESASPLQERTNSPRVAASPGKINLHAAAVTADAGGTKSFRVRGARGASTGSAGKLKSGKNFVMVQKRAPMSAKQEMVAKQKADAARKIREEKQRLKEEKKKRQEDFLRKTAEKRDKMEQQAEVRRLAMKHQSNAEIASRELEIADRQWTLEQERLFRLEQKEEERRQRREEEEIKARERAVKQEAERKQKEKEDAERRQFQLNLADELEHSRFCKELERMEQKEEFSKRSRAREEAKLVAEEQRELAVRRAQESRELDEAAYQDVQQYLKAERESRRQSIVFRLNEASQWRKEKEQQDHFDQIMERKDRELELAAYNDMKRYLESEKAKRRQSLQDYLKQESEYRKLQELENDAERLKEAQSRALDDAAYRDAQNYLKEQENLRRQSIADRLQKASEEDMQAMRDAEERERQEQASRRLDALAEEDVRQSQEDEAERERAFATAQHQEQLEAAKKREFEVETKLQDLNNAKQEDIQDYQDELAGRFFLSKEDVSALDQVECSITKEQDQQGDEDDRGRETESKGAAQDGTEQEEQGKQEEEEEQEEDEPLPAPPRLVAGHGDSARAPAPVSPTSQPATEIPTNAKGCCVIS